MSNFGPRKELPVNKYRLLLSQAQNTIKGPLDAIVELVTNADDAYTRRKVAGGKISVTYKGAHGCFSKLEVLDSAGGMSPQKLSEAIEYASAASEFSAHTGVRGFFGRGLKEAIIALGKGTIVTRSDGVAVKTQIEVDQAKEKVFVREPTEIALQEAENYGLQDDGTLVRIEAEHRSDKVAKIGNPEQVKEEVSNHFALREIWSRRDGGLQWEVVEGKGSRVRRRKQEVPQELKPRPRSGKLVLSETLSVGDVGGVEVKVWRSDERLSGRPDEPCSDCGFVVRSEGVPLEKRGFLEGRPGTGYLWGSIEVPAIAEALRKGDVSMLLTNRSGLSWRHKICQALKAAVEAKLEPIVKEIEVAEADAAKRADPDLERRLKRDTELLNRLAKELGLDSDSPAEGGTGVEPVPISKLIVRPEFSRIPPGSKRDFSIYVPVNVFARALGQHVEPVVQCEIVGSDKASVSRGQCHLADMSRGKICTRAPWPS